MQLQRRGGNGRRLFAPLAALRTSLGRLSVIARHACFGRCCSSTRQRCSSLVERQPLAHLGKNMEGAQQSRDGQWRAQTPSAWQGHRIGISSDPRPHNMGLCGRSLDTMATDGAVGEREQPSCCWTTGRHSHVADDVIGGACLCVGSAGAFFVVGPLMPLYRRASARMALSRDMGSASDVGSGSEAHARDLALHVSRSGPVAPTLQAVAPRIA